MICMQSSHRLIHLHLLFQTSKVMAKKELAYVPLIGWMWYFQEIVFCKRKWEEDRRTVNKSLQNLRDYPENFWVRLPSSHDIDWKKYEKMFPLHRPINGGPPHNEKPHHKLIQFFLPQCDSCSFKNLH